MDEVRRDISRNHMRDHRDFSSGYAYANAALNEFTQRYVNRPLSFLLSLLLAIGNLLAGRDICPGYLALSITSKHMVIINKKRDAILRECSRELNATRFARLNFAPRACDSTTR